MTYDILPEESITEGVITAVAEFSGYDPVPDVGANSDRAMEPLYEAVDPDALDTLFEGATADQTCEVTFQYMGYDVTVQNGTEISISRREPVTLN